MFNMPVMSLPRIVASFADAWIEIHVVSAFSNPFTSHPSRMRGLKSEAMCPLPLGNSVASFADAWIEIERLGHTSIDTTSHPSRMRGLK